MYISYDYYRIFYYVAKYSSFTRAANALLNNQPNITRSIKNLEGELGCTLFVRSNRSVSLTPEGERLYEHIRIAFEHIQAGEEELAMNRSLQKGIVSIGASETALHCLLLPVLKDYRRKYPGIRVKVGNYSTPQAVSALKNGLVDFAVVTTPVTISDPLKSREIKTFRETAICGAAFSRLAGRRVTLKELAEYPLICLGAQTKTYEFYARLFSECGITLSPDTEAATADQILPMVENDLGIGFVPQEFLKNVPLGKNVFVLDLEEQIPERTICLVKRSDRPLGVAAEELEKMIRETVK